MFNFRNKQSQNADFLDRIRSDILKCTDSTSLFSVVAVVGVPLSLRDTLHSSMLYCTTAFQSFLNLIFSMPDYSILLGMLGVKVGLVLYSMFLFLP